MCGRFNLQPDGKTEAMLRHLKVSGTPRYAADIAPGTVISMVRGGAQERELATAIWWLLLDPTTLKPNYQYASFNSRYDKLNEPRALAYHPFRTSRCIIPASAFVEGLGDKQTYHKIEHVDRAIAFGGLYRTYVNAATGAVVHGASIITLPPVDKWRTIHPKSLPLMLDVDDEDLLSRWLDPTFTEISVFADVLKPVLRQPQWITPIDKPGTWRVVGESKLIS